MELRVALVLLLGVAARAEFSLSDGESSQPRTTASSHFDATQSPFCCCHFFCYAHSPSCTGFLQSFRKLVQLYHHLHSGYVHMHLSFYAFSTSATRLEYVAQYPQETNINI
jgi:hypothetical protein